MTHPTTTTTTENKKKFQQLSFRGARTKRVCDWDCWSSKSSHVSYTSCERADSSWEGTRGTLTDGHWTLSKGALVLQNHILRINSSIVALIPNHRPQAINTIFLKSNWHLYTPQRTMNVNFVVAESKYLWWELERLLFPPYHIQVSLLFAFLNAKIFQPPTKLSMWLQALGLI